MSDEIYYQCLLRHEDTRTVGWISGRGAQKGKYVELKEADTPNLLWEVVEVYQPGRTLVEVREKQRKDRNSLASIYHI